MALLQALAGHSYIPIEISNQTLRPVVAQSVKSFMLI
jgi:hypothetical protein